MLINHNTNCTTVRPIYVTVVSKLYIELSAIYIKCSSDSVYDVQHKPSHFVKRSIINCESAICFPFNVIHGVFPFEPNGNSSSNYFNECKMFCRHKKRINEQINAFTW